MTYTLDEAKSIAATYNQRCEEIHNLNISKYEQAVKIADLLTDLEYLGIPVLMVHAKSWVKESEGNALLLQTYREIGSTRDF